jgi:hypothetical protein
LTHERIRDRFNGSQGRRIHHRPKGGASHDYGDRHVAAMGAEIEKYPRYKIAALKKEPVPHKHRRRTVAQLAAAAEAKAIRKASRPAAGS